MSASLERRAVRVLVDDRGVAVRRRFDCDSGHGVCHGDRVGLHRAAERGPERLRGRSGGHRQSSQRRVRVIACHARLRRRSGDACRAGVLVRLRLRLRLRLRVRRLGAARVLPDWFGRVAVGAACGLVAVDAIVVVPRQTDRLVGNVARWRLRLIRLLRSRSACLGAGRSVRLAKDQQDEDGDQGCDQAQADGRGPPQVQRHDCASVFVRPSTQGQR